MKDNKPTLKRLETADPRAYAKLCEKAGCYLTAFEYYKKSDDAIEIYHASELAQTIGRKKREVVQLAKRAFNKAEKRINELKNPSHPDLSSGIGRAMCLIGAETTRDKIKRSLELLISKQK